MSENDPNRARKQADNPEHTPDAIPLAYHITVRCYGTRLLGDEAGSVHHSNNIPGTPIIPHKPDLVRHEKEIMDQPPYELDAPRRRIVLDTIIEVCQYRDWDLLAAHVRTNHFHVVVSALAQPEKVMNDLKSYTSRNLNNAGYDCRGRKRWARHGSTKYKWKPDEVEEAVDYVVREQGEAMEYYEKQ